MINPTREQIAVALFTQLQTAGAVFSSYSRRPVIWNNAPSYPALYVGQPQETYVYNHGSATPAAVTLDFEVFVYINAGLDMSVIPDTMLNNCLDALDAAMAATPATNNVQTLGGLVNHAWIEDKIIRIPGWIDGEGSAILTIKALVPF